MHRWFWTLPYSLSIYKGTTLWYTFYTAGTVSQPSQAKPSGPEIMPSAHLTVYLSLCLCLAHISMMRACTRRLPKPSPYAICGRMAHTHTNTHTHSLTSVLCPMSEFCGLHIYAQTCTRAYLTCICTTMYKLSAVRLCVCICVCVCVFLCLGLQATTNVKIDKRDQKK